jgi:hypothetical protein
MRRSVDSRFGSGADTQLGTVRGADVRSRAIAPGRTAATFTDRKQFGLRPKVHGSFRAMLVIVPSIPVEVNSKSTRSPCLIALRSAFGALKVIVIAGHFNASTGPCEMVTVYAVASTASTTPLADAMTAGVAGIAGVGAFAGGGVAVAAGGVSVVGDVQAASSVTASRSVVDFMVSSSG